MIGTDDYDRGTLDTNSGVSDTIAVRVNAMVHSNELPGRDVERFRAVGHRAVDRASARRPTRLTIGYVHQEDDNVPVYGVPYYRSL